MARTYFGTDGIRGRINAPPMTVETAMRLAIAAGRTFGSTDDASVVIGRDTRQSGLMIEQALSAGLSSIGLTAISIGIVPTPAVALMTRETGANLGLMVSASHNKAADNGIKLFSPAGIKLTDAEEERLEQAMADAFTGAYAPPERITEPSRIPGASHLYVDRCIEAVGADLDLSGLKIVLDCAHGAAFITGPDALRRLGADLTVIGNVPDGMNINAGFGSTDTVALRAAILEQKADIGIAFDGDADRLIVLDETGAEIDGDQIMALIATEMHQAGKLRGGGMVATVMSNMGLAEHLKSLGLSLARTRVGDRYVGAHMRTHGFNLGGEQSGHIILSDVSTTGDGLLAALHVLRVVARRAEPVSRLAHVFTPAPQELVNIRFSGTNPLETDEVKAAIENAEKRMGERGRMVVRKSGTEPLIRVMAEALDATLMKDALNQVVNAVRTKA